MDFTSLFKGCLGVKVFDGKYRPFRLTERQEEYYRSKSEGFLIRARCQAGVSMEFLTGEKEFSFCYEVFSRARHTTVFDIYEDDVLTEHIRVNNNAGFGKIDYQKRKPGKSKIAVYFHYGAEIAVYDIDLKSFEALPAKGKRYLALGDSVTQGMDASHPSINYPGLVARLLDVEVLNQSIAGYFFDPKTLDENLSYSPDLVTAAFGTNDLSVVKDDGELLLNAEGYLQKLHALYSTSKVFILSPIWRSEYDSSKAFRSRYHLLENFLEENAGKLGFGFVSGLSLVPVTPEFYDDFLHPNDAGFLFYALNLAKVLRE